MSNNLRKFVNPKFTRTIDPELIGAAASSGTATCSGLRPRTRCAAMPMRRAMRSRRSSPDLRNTVPKASIADLHRIAELGTPHGLRLIAGAGAVG